MALVVTIVSIVVKELLAQLAFYIGRKTKNTVVTADGWHHRSDSLSSVIVLIGIIVSMFAAELWWMDSVLGMFYAVVIFYATIKIMMNSVTKILGVEPNQELIDQIKAEVCKIYGDNLKLHHFHLHNYISQKELTLHIMLGNTMTIEEGHQIATVIENMIKEQFNIITTIHVELLLRS